MELKNNDVLIITNTDWFFLLHRSAIANSFKNEGCNITVATRNTGKKNDIIELGYNFVDVDFDRKGTNIIKELRALIQLNKVFKVIKPDLVYQVTIKPVIYGGVLSKIYKTKIINTICGLGYVFSKSKYSFFKKGIIVLYKLSLKNSNSFTFFENKDDRNYFLKLNLVDLNNSGVVNGAGVDLNKFKKLSYTEEDQDKKLVVILPTRMLWNKGIKEFVEAANILRDKYENKVFFKLYGMVDIDNPESISVDYLNNIEIPDYLKWFGFVEDMVSVYNEANIVVLPSYYGEGLPTVLAEACAMNLPIITTNSVGCRECVDDGINGFKIPVKSSKELAEAVNKILSDSDLRIEMGKASRIKAEREFDQIKIVSEYKRVFVSLLKK